MVLFLLLAATGALLLVTHELSPERAHGTVAALVDEARSGAFDRSAQAWAANGLALITFLHLPRFLHRGGHLSLRDGSLFRGTARGRSRKAPTATLSRNPPHPIIAGGTR